MKCSKMARSIAALALLCAIPLGLYAAKRLTPPPSSPATEAMRAATTAFAADSPAPGPAPSATATPTTQRARLMDAAFGLVGKPYAWGAKGPGAYDCSGFTKAAYAAAGVRLPDGSFNQAAGEEPLRHEDQLTAGDLLLYRWPDSVSVAHVTIYAGDGWVIGTGSPGKPPKVVVYPLADDLRADGRIITFRHVRLADER